MPIFIAHHGWGEIAPGSSRFFRVVAVSVLRHAVFVLQHMSSRFFSAPRQFPSVCRAISSACGASVSSRFSTSALHPLRSGLIPCCFPPSSLQIGPSRRKVGRQTQNWFFTNLFGSACLARIREIGCVKLIPTSWKRSSFPSMHLGRVAQLAEQLTLNQ